MAKHYFIYYKIDSEDAQDIEDFFKYITSAPAVNSFIPTITNGENTTTDLPDGCLITYFPDDFTLQMVYQHFQDLVSNATVSYQDLVCVEMAHMNSLFLGRVIP